MVSWKDGYEVRHRHDLQYLQSATLVVQPQLLDNILSAVGIEQLIYLYAKVCMYVHVCACTGPGGDLWHVLSGVCVCILFLCACV